MRARLTPPVVPQVVHRHSTSVSVDWYVLQSTGSSPYALNSSRHAVNRQPVTLPLVWLSRATQALPWYVSCMRERLPSYPQWVHLALSGHDEGPDFLPPRWP